MQQDFYNNDTQNLGVSIFRMVVNTEEVRLVPRQIRPPWTFQVHGARFLVISPVFVLQTNSLRAN